MRQVREVLRLMQGCGRSLREAGRAVGVSAATAMEYLRRAEAAGISWPIPAEIDDAALEARLFPAPEGPLIERPMPDWATIHAEMKRKGVTLALLWQEYQAEHADGYGYSIEIDDHWYSAPFQLIKEPVEARITAHTVEIYHKGTRVAAHARSRMLYRHTTIREHMPSSHRRYIDWTPKRLKSEAAGIGAATAALVEHILEDRPHPEQGFRACLGVLALKRRYGALRLEAACMRGLDLNARTCGAIAEILKNGLEQAFLETAPTSEPILHANIRGPGYYN